MANSKRKKIMMVSTGVLKTGKPSKYAYYSTKGPNITDKLKQRKFDPRTGKHELFEEKKVPK